ncbi:MAG: hypothetical protein HY253_11550 [Burkholderiales bacterium]|nr:hypothetical protein [Burkholderiales bacterium]
MQTQTLLRMSLCLLCFVSAGIHAGEDQKGVKEKEVSPVPLDTKYSWNGDIIKFHANFPNVKVGNKTVCAPSKSEFAVSTEDKTTHKLTGVFLDLGGKQCSSSDALTSEKLDPNTTYVLEKAEVELAPHSRRGWTFGALALPFKYQFSDKTFTNATTIGPYLGYGVNSNWGDFMGGTSTTLVFSAGWVNNIDVPLLKAADAKESTGTVNRSGFTTAVGIVFSVDKGTGMQFGVFAGQDRLGRNTLAPYKYEGKWWLSGMVGYKFF